MIALLEVINAIRNLEARIDDKKATITVLRGDEVVVEVKFYDRQIFELVKKLLYSK